MGIRTGRQYLEGLKDDREIWIDGERVKDVATDPRFEGAAATIAELFDLQSQPDLKDKMTYTSPTTGDPVGLSHIIPQSKDDLVARREMIKVWMDHTCGMFGRSMDFMNCLMAGLAAPWKDFDRPAHPFGQHLKDYYEYSRENDLVLTHTLVPPQVDRSRPIEEQTKDVAARIVKETDKGFVIRGARIVTTLCAFSDHIQAAPSAYLNMNDEAKAYAYSFSIPISTPGLKFVCRPSLVNQSAASPMDAPLGNRLDEGDGVVIFDDVLVPWENTFIFRDIEMCNGLFNRTGAMWQTAHQFSTKNLAKAEFMMGLGFAIAKSTKIDTHLHVQNMLAELINYTEFVRACLVACEAGATEWYHGATVPDPMPLWTVRQMFPKMFHRMCEIVQLLGAGGIVAVPSFAEIEGPMKEAVEAYCQSAMSDSKSRIKLFRLAYDAAVSSFSGRQQLYERYYSGDPVRLAGLLYDTYDKDTYIDRIHGMLDDLEARMTGGPSPHSFAPRTAAPTGQAAE